MTRRISVTRFAAGVLAMSWGVGAQEVQKIERIEVTGTHIKRIDSETPAPVQIITRDDIEKSGRQTVADVIRDIPADSNGSISLAFSSGFAAGGSAVSLRGFNAGSTLVLINGRRSAPYGLADDGIYNFVNLSTIPLDAVERIEVLKDGASAIYGSDAITGVVNIILRNNFQGATVSGSWGQTRYGDGDKARATIVAGWGDIAKDGYNVFVNVEAASQEAIWQKDRASRAWIGDPDVRQWGYDITGGTQLGHLLGFIRPATRQTLQIISGNPLGAVRNPNPANLEYAQLPGCNSPYTLSPGLGGCLWAPSDYLQVIPQEKSISILGRGVFQFASAVRGYVEGGVYSDKVRISSAPSAVTGNWPDVPHNTFRNTGVLNLMGANHPDNPFGAPARLRYVTADVGPRRRELDTRVDRLVAGVKGDAWDWDFDTALFYSASRTTSRTYGALRDSVLRSLLDGTSPLGYYRIGINSHLNSPELYAALSPTLEFESKTSVASWDLKASRDVMQLAGGPLALALGAEARKEKVDKPPNPYSREADIVGSALVDYHQSRNVVSAYAELSAPVTKQIEVAAAARTDRYSDYGRSTTPKLGIRWTPMSALLLRATYAEGFRAPGPTESGNSTLAAGSFFLDPVRCAVPGATGCTGNAVTIITGRPDVPPQISKSHTAGIVFEPVRDASVSVDYWKIRREHEIDYPDLTRVVPYPNLYPRATIIRDDNDLPGIPGSGTVLAVYMPFPTESHSETSGFDLDARYRFNVGAYGRVSLELLWTYVRYFRRTFPDGATVEYADTHGPSLLSSNAGLPRNRGAFTITWERGPWTVASTTSYVSGVEGIESKDNPIGCWNHFANGDPAPDGCRVGSFITTSLFGRYRWSKNLEVFGSIQNLFDRIAPLDPETYGAYRYNPTFHLPGAIGRQYSVGARYTFK